MPRIDEALGGPPMWIKRDDCTGLATGGNKARKLEYLMGAAKAEDANGVITFGALQSNHARQTAAAAAALGLSCDLILVTNVDYREPAWEESGNRLLDELLGARVHAVADEAAALGLAKELLDKSRDEGRQLHVIPVGGSSPIGALGYVGCALELIDQLGGAGINEATVVHASSSLGTQAGLLVGFHAAKSEHRVCGVAVSDHDEAGRMEALEELCSASASLLETEPPPKDRHRIETGFLGPGYGVPTDAMYEAVESLARYEGILLDPVYTGKAMAWLMDSIRRGECADRPVVFLHTGGNPGLFAYQRFLSGRLNR
jgi:D-cysteine desulfhydrase family pyridoxal phosphate-dependent enzyme